MLRMTTNRLQKILLAYWLIVPILFYLYLGITSFIQETSIQQMLQVSPGIALGNLLACLMLLQAGIFFFVRRFSQSKNGLLGQFTFVAIPQQLLTGNIIGAVLAFFLARSLNSGKEDATLQTKIIFYFVLGFIFLFSCLTAFIAFRLRGA